MRSSPTPRSPRAVPSRRGSAPPAHVPRSRRIGSHVTDELFRLWVYLSSTPLAGLTLTPVASLADRLRALGHDVSVLPLTSGAGAILRERGTWAGGADPRREGTARGERP